MNVHRRERGEWHDAARLLKDRNPGMSCAEIGRLLGVTQPAVYKALNPERAKAYNAKENRTPGRQERKIAWQREFDRSEAGRAKCSNPICSELMGIGSARLKYEFCLACHRSIAEVRRTLAEGMWADGWRLVDMADAFDVRPAYFSIRRLQDGWDLPYRYANTKRQLAVAA